MVPGVTRLTSMKQTIFGIAKLAAGMAIVSWLVWSNKDALGAIDLNTLRLGYLLLGCVVLVVAISVSFIRWWGLVKGVGLSLGIRDAMIMGYVGYAFNLLLPGAVGGDLVKSVMIARRQSRRVAAVATIFMDRIMGLLGLVIITTLIGGCWVLFGQPQDSVRSIALASCLFSPFIIVGLFVLFSRTIVESKLVRVLSEHAKLGTIVSGAVDAIRAYRSNPAAIVVAIVLTLAGQSLLILGIWLVGASLFPEPAPLGSHFLLMPLGLSAGAVPLTPGGLGVLDVAIVELYKLAGNNPAAAVAMMLGYRLVQVTLSVFGFALYFLFARKLIDHSTPQTI